MNLLRPVSPFERGLLEALGETAAEHQQQIMDFKRPKWAKETKPKSKPSPRDVTQRLVNKEFFSSFDAGPPTAATIVAGLQPDAFISEAYVLFKRHQVCRNCHRTYDLQDSSQLFLRQRPSRKDPANTKIYTPVRSITHKELPRVVEVLVSSSPVCLACFSEAPCQKEEVPSSSPQDDTSSLGPSTTLTTGSLADSSSSSPPSPSSASSLEPPVDGSLAQILPDLSSQTLCYTVGTGSENESDKSPADAGPSNTLTAMTIEFAEENPNGSP